MLRSCKQHPSVGCSLPLTAFRTSLGGKWTRFSRNNSNTKIHRSNIIYPVSDACTAVRCYLDGAGFVWELPLCARIIGRSGTPDELNPINDERIAPTVGAGSARPINGE